MKRTLLMALVAVCTGAVTALAHEGHEHGDEHRMEGTRMEIPAACADEAKTACPGMTPGDGKFGPCMKEHRDSMSQGCRDAMKGMMAEHMKGKRGEWKERMAKACGADAQSFCSGMEPGDGKYHPCLMEHKDQLSDSCKAFMAEMHGKKEKMRDRWKKGSTPEKGEGEKGEFGKTDAPGKDENGQ